MPPDIRTLNNTSAGSYVTGGSAVDYRTTSNDVYNRRSNETESLTASLVGSSSIGVTRYPADTPKHFTRLDVYSYGTRDNYISVNPLSLGQSIILPLPKQLVDAHDVIYEVFTIGPVTGKIINDVYNAGHDNLKQIVNDYRTKGLNAAVNNQLSNIAQGAKNTGKSVMNRALDKFRYRNHDYSKDSIGTIRGMMDNAGETVAKGALVGSSISPGIAGAIDWASQNVGVNVRGGIQSKYGVTPNHFEVVLFHGPAFKHHTLVWDFSPRSAAEAETVNKIIRDMNNYVSPGLTFGGTLFSFPRIFKVSYRTAGPNGSNEMDYLYKFKPAVCSDLIVNYMDSNGLPVFHKDTKPAHYTVSMHFIELEYWLSGQFRGSMD